MFRVLDDPRHTVVVLPAFGAGQVGMDEWTYSLKFHVDLLIFLGGGGSAFSPDMLAQSHNLSWLGG